MKYYLRTWGCQMNVHDSEKIAGIFTESGYGKNADVIVLNTCSIRQKAEQKFYSELGRLKKVKQHHPDLKIAVAGCIAQQEGDNIIKRFPFVDFLFGPNNIDSLHILIDNGGSRTAIEDNPLYHTKLLPMRREGRVKAWVSIMFGCDNYCSYCVVPYTRGRERSRTADDIQAEARRLAEQGFREITLLGQNVNSYGKTLKDGGDFPDLLKVLHEVDGVDRIRFVTSHPRDLSGKLISAMKDLPKVCEHLHLPVQSGSDRVLKLMNRGYTYSEYKEKIDLLRQEVPGIAITTDIIVGFPGETEDDYEETKSALRETGYDGIFAFQYSERPNTKALELPGHIDKDTKARRLSEVLLLQESVTYQKNSELEGKMLEVLVEGLSETDSDRMTGRTRTNKIVNYSGYEEDIGKLVMIEILEAKQHSLLGKKIQGV
jgi:tRNA-2-methylthio-N6-dimethylallyladenosine synthase